jgi:hypothetical protein
MKLEHRIFGHLRTLQQRNRFVRNDQETGLGIIDSFILLEIGTDPEITQGRHSPERRWRTQMVSRAHATVSLASLGTRHARTDCLCRLTRRGCVVRPAIRSLGDPRYLHASRSSSPFAYDLPRTFEGGARQRENARGSGRFRSSGHVVRKLRRERPKEQFSLSR